MNESILKLDEIKRKAYLTAHEYILVMIHFNFCG